MTRAEKNRSPSPQFTSARRWRPWQELAGFLGVAAGVGAWILLFAAVAQPLGASLALLDGSAGRVPAAYAQDVELARTSR